MEIISKNNNLIKELKKEAKNKFLLFLDTPKLVHEAMISNLKVKYILQDKSKKFDFVQSVETDKVIYVSKEILKYFSNVETNAGIVGIFYYPKKNYEIANTNYLVLDNVQDAGNVGTLIRSAYGANFRTIYLLNSASVTNQKVVRSTAGTIFKMQIFEMTKEEFLNNFKQDNLYVASMDGENVFNFKHSGKIGIALGNEGNGVSKEIISLAKNKKICVPMENSLESLNVAVSGAILMYAINFKGE